MCATDFSFFVGQYRFQLLNQKFNYYRIALYFLYYNIIFEMSPFRIFVRLNSTMFEFLKILLIRLVLGLIGPLFGYFTYMKFAWSYLCSLKMFEIINSIGAKIEQTKSISRSQNLPEIAKVLNYLKLFEIFENFFQESWDFQRSMKSVALLISVRFQEAKRF